MFPPTPQPAVAVLALRRISKRDLAKQLGRSEQYVSRVLLGHERASVPFRRDLAALLDLPEAELFHAEAVAR